MKLVMLVALLLQVSCGNARMPNDVIEDGLQQLRSELEQLVGHTKTEVISELGEPVSVAVDTDTLHEVLNYHLTAADVQLLINATNQLENYLIVNKGAPNGR